MQFPFQFVDAYSDAHMKFAGGKSQMINQLRLINKNTCSDAKDCQCVLFIHGLGDQALTWRKVFMESGSATGINLYAVDLPGSGLSSHLPSTSDYGISRLADLVSEEVMPLCESWTIVGNSFGGWIATRLALMHPVEINGLMLVSSAGLDANYDHVWPTFVYPTVEKLRSAAELTYAKQVNWPDFILQKVISRWGSMPIKEMVIAQEDNEFVDTELHKIKIPVQLFWGDKDKLIPVYMAKRFAKAIPQAELKVQENCGHLAQQECPKEVWASLQNLLADSTQRHSAKN